MTLISRLLGKPQPQPMSSVERAGNDGADAHAGGSAMQRNSGVIDLGFGEELLRTALDAGDEQRAAQKRLAELIDAGEVTVAQLPDGAERREALLAILALCADGSPFEQVAQNVQDARVWLRLATSGPSPRLRQLAALRVEGEDDLRAVLKSARDSDKNVYRIAKTKLDELHAAAKRVEEARAHLVSIGETIERHSYKPFDGAYVATLEHLVGEWEAGQLEVPQELRERVDAAIDRARTSITNHIRAAGAQAARESAIANAEPLRASVLEELQKILSALYGADTFGAAEAQAADERLTKLGQRWADTLQYKQASGQEKAQFDRLQQAARRAASASLAQGTVRQQVDAAGATPTEQVYARIESLLADTWLLPEDTLPAVVTEAKERAAAWRASQAQHRADVADAERQITHLIRRAQQALAGGQSRQALGIRRSLEPKLAHFAHLPKPLAERLHQLDDKLKELQDWKSFAVTPKRSELIEQMQALIGAEEGPVQLAEQIRRLQEEWKSLAKGSTDTEEDWNKFHEAAQAAYAPCKTHFEAQAKIRETNLAKRKALVARLADYEASTDWANVEWKYVANAVRSAKQEWRDSGPTDRGPTKSLEKSFDALIAKINARLDAEYSSNLEQKQSLVEQARRLGTVEDLAQAGNDVKRLQAAWRTIGLTPHAEGQRLWDEFKSLCDAVFDKRRQQHSERVSELKQTETQALAMCTEAEALAKPSGAELLAGAARLRELRDSFGALGDLPRESAQAIQRRFRRALEQFDQAIAAHKQREADAAWDAMFDAANRVRLHRLGGDSSDVELRAHLDAIKHWPKGGAQAIERKLAQPATDPAKAGESLRVLAIRAEIASGRSTPEADQMQRRTMQLQALVNGTGRTTATPKEQLEALAFEWVAAGAAPTALHDELFARFRAAWDATRR